ncbi:hypothetical protein [Stenotrophomonas maltophilia]|uniref:hypothetical protein n=1 Tax=Stenotrophomonas maltophilia TaxID=40324 RepID=UPI001132672C|nr:hypothetical protein [Stenotrophomonas maltophilia]
MKISELQAWLSAQSARYGDIDVVCMTAPFADGEVELVEGERLGVSTTPGQLLPDATSSIVITIGCR